MKIPSGLSRRVSVTFVPRKAFLRLGPLLNRLSGGEVLFHAGGCPTEKKFVDLIEDRSLR
jgi:hypothetical protein